MSGFTPGPWRLSGVDVVDGDDHWCINGHALVSGFHSPTDCRLATVYTIEANARLIAAAPELLEALQWYVQNDDTNVGQEGNEFYEAGLSRAEAAIAKATQPCQS